MNKISLLIIAISILAFTHCSKKDNPASKTALLTSGTWKLTAVNDDNDGDGIYETDEFSGYLNCYKDNFHTFRANGEFELNEGATKCDSRDPQTFVTTWQLTTNETILVIHLDSYIIEELNNATLRIKLPLSHNRSSMITYSKR